MPLVAFLLLFRFVLVVFYKNGHACFLHEEPFRFSPAHSRYTFLMAAGSKLGFYNSLQRILMNFLFYHVTATRC